MPLLSIEFAVFFIAFLPLYWAFARLPQVQNVLLLVAGLGWLYRIDPIFAALILVYSSVVYLVSVLMFLKREYPQILAGLRYFGSIDCFVFLQILRLFPPDYSAIYGAKRRHRHPLPLGLSYYTFQSLAYLVYCYREPKGDRFEWHELLLHLSFFPTITSGPIIRAAAFKSIDGEQAGALAQIRTKQARQLIYPALAVGLIVLGIAKKWWLAGVLAEGWVSPVFENPAQFDGWGVLSAIYGYTFQLFFDFSGYSDLVIGLAMLLGFQLPKNFAAPLRAINIRDFWDRWHISLSTWIRDYIYIPLGGSKKGFGRTQLNLMIAMLLSGIWHGYGWSFLIWGALHGAALVFLNCSDKIVGRNALGRLKIGKPLAWLFTFHFVCFAFVVFNSATLADTEMLFSALFANDKGWNAPLPTDLMLLGAFAMMLLLYPYLLRLFEASVKGLDKLPAWLWFIPITLILALIIVFAPSGIPGFIYANF